MQGRRASPMPWLSAGPLSTFGWKTIHGRAYRRAVPPGGATRYLKISITQSA